MQPRYILIKDYLAQFQASRGTKVKMRKHLMQSDFVVLKAGIYWVDTQAEANHKPVSKNALKLAQRMQNA